MNSYQDNVKWSENVILADADYVDRVAFDLTVNFERMLGRRIPKADMARWIDCVVLDGGLREGANETQVVLMHGKEKRRMENFAPAGYEDELNGQAFCDNLGEFAISALTVEEDMVTAGELFLDVLGTLCGSKDVRRIMVIPDAEAMYDDVRATLRHYDDGEKRITVFAMQPMPGGNFRQEILGYSLMQALGIRAGELDAAR